VQEFGAVDRHVALSGLLDGVKGNMPVPRGKGRPDRNGLYGPVVLEHLFEGVLLDQRV